MVEALMEEIAIWEKEEADKGTLQHGAPSIHADARAETNHDESCDDDAGRVRLPVLK